MKKISAHEAIILEKLPAYFLVFCTLGAAAFLLYIMSSLLTVIFVAAVLSAAFYPIFKKLSKQFKGKWDWLASILSCLIVVVVIILPITLFIIVLASEGMATYEMIQENLESGTWDKYLYWGEGGIIYDFLNDLGKAVDWEQIDIKGSIVNLAQNLSSYLVAQTATILQGVSNLAMNFFLMIFAMFYFFKDGEAIVKKIGDISPLPSEHEDELFEKLGYMVKAVMMGVFLTAILQGLVGGIGFSIAGISSPIFWGAAMAFASLVPMVGTALIWIPTAAILAATGSWGGAIFIAIWGALVVGSIDNFVRPMLIGGKAQTYPLLTFFVILGGIFTLGFKGLIIGPLALMALMALLHIYETEYKKVLKK